MGVSHFPELKYQQQRNDTEAHTPPSRVRPLRLLLCPPAGSSHRSLHSDHWSTLEGARGRRFPDLPDYLACSNEIGQSGAWTYCATDLEASSVRSGCQHSWVLVKTLFPARRWRPSPSVLTWSRERERCPLLLSSRGPHTQAPSTPTTSQWPISNCHHVGG